MKRKQKFKVTITRVETYRHQVEVVACSMKEAQDKAYEMDCQDKFADEWNEIDPSIETTYTTER